MPRFSYDAVDAAGRPAKGDLEAADRRAAARRLAARGLSVSRLAEADGKGVSSPRAARITRCCIRRARSACIRRPPLSYAVSANCTRAACPWAMP